MKFVVFAAICLVSVYARPDVGALRSRPSGRIIGGKEANAGQFPFAAAITVETQNGHHFCGGTLLTGEYVLTSAFCAQGAFRFEIVLGTTNLKQHNPYTITLATSTYILHPLFNPQVVRNDIALIKFHLPIEITDYVKPIDDLAVGVLGSGASVVTYGWGQLNDQEPAPVDQLHFVELTTLANAECQHYYGSAINEEMVCVAGNFNEGTCHGDMGAPLIQYQGNRAVHVGLASFLSGNGCETPEPSGYTRTFHYRDWIRNQTGV